MKKFPHCRRAFRSYEYQTGRFREKNISVWRQDMHIERAARSVMQYGRMRGKIETMEENNYLQESGFLSASMKKNREETACLYKISGWKSPSAEVRSLDKWMERGTDRDCGTEAKKANLWRKAASEKNASNNFEDCGQWLCSHGKKS